MKFRQYIKEAVDKKGFDVRSIEDETISNDNFRKVLVTGKNLQLVVMSLKPEEDIGNEVHENVDQFFRIDSGEGKVVIEEKDEYPVKDGSSIIIKAGTYHNIINTSKTEDLKLYTIYSPPNHPEGTIHKTKEDAMKEEDH
jgi:mannose-6-phosphate isomerase-like protein (cupin superfamily)